MMKLKFFTIVLSAFLSLLLVSCTINNKDHNRDDPNDIDDSQPDAKFDYTESDLSKYVELSKEDYKGYTLDLAIAKPHDIDVDVAILNLISSEKYRTLEGNGAYLTGVAPTPGDKVVVRFRGYTLDDKGNKDPLPPILSNMTAASGLEIQIGEANTSLPIGFELGIIDKDPTDYAKFEKITEGKAKDHENGDDWVIYVTYTRTLKKSIGTDNEKKDTVKGSSIRMDLSDVEALETKYGKGFVETVKAYSIGQTYSVELDIGDEEYRYTSLKIDFATTCEKQETSENGKAPLVVEGYFSYDFGTAEILGEYRNKTVYYEVYIEKVIPYTVKSVNAETGKEELTEEFILELIEDEDSTLTREELDAFKGETLLEKYRAYAKNALDEAYKEALDIMIENAMWERYLAKAKILKYPEIKVTEIYDEYVKDVYYQFEQNGGSLQDQTTGDFTSYESVEEFAIAYLGLTEGTDWRATLKTMSENLVKERLILFYIMRQENIMPTEDALNKKIKELKDEHLDEYIKAYLARIEKKKSDYTDEEYKEFVAERTEEIFSYYDDDYFKETAYYEIGLEHFLKFPGKITTLDDKKTAEIK